MFPKPVKNTFYFCLLFSFVAHLVTIYYDQIHLELTFKFSEEQEKIFARMEENKESVQNTMHTTKDKEMLSQYLNEEQKKFLSEAKSEFLSKQKGTGQSKEKSEAKAGSGGVAPGFRAFISKETKNEIVKSSPIPVELSYGGYKKLQLTESQKCNGQTYVGIGLALNNYNPFQPEASPWKIEKVAQGYVADKINLKQGDVFIGMKDKDGKFWEGNTLIKTGLKAGTIVEALFRQNDKIVSKKIALEEICYNTVSK